MANSFIRLKTKSTNTSPSSSNDDDNAWCWSKCSLRQGNAGEKLQDPKNAKRFDPQTVHAFTNSLWELNEPGYIMPKGMEKLSKDQLDDGDIIAEPMLKKC